MTPMLGILASQITGHLSTNSFESIQTVTGNGSSASLTFSSIPSTYKHLEIRGIAQAAYSSTDWGSIGIRFNSDTGSNYTRHGLRGATGISPNPGAYSVTPNTWADAGDGAYLNSGSIFGASIISILDYTNTNKYKTVRGLSGTDFNTGGAISLASGLWMSTSSVTSVTIFQQNANFATGTQFALYGIKG